MNNNEKRMATYGKVHKVLFSVSDTAGKFVLGGMKVLVVVGAICVVSATACDIIRDKMGNLKDKINKNR